jgi:putative membrane protein
VAHAVHTPTRALPGGTDRPSLVDPRASGGYHPAMLALLWTASLAAALLHVAFFLLESILWMRPAVHLRAFRVPTERAEAVRLFAFNQGFYNLFLAAEVGVGLGLLSAGHAAAGAALVAFACASMVGAALVLAASSPGSWRGAVLQGLPPALALAALAAR